MTRPDSRAHTAVEFKASLELVGKELQRLRLARWGVSGVFLVLGFSVAAWATNLPAVQRRTAISSVEIGLVIVVMGLGTIAGAQISGQLLHRLGSRTLASTGVGLLLGALSLMPLTHDGVILALLAAFFGAGFGCIDVSMNNQAAGLQRSYGRPIMSTFHALFSVGNAVGAGYSAILQALHTRYALIMLAFVGVALIVGIASLIAMAPESALAAPPSRPDHANADGPVSSLRRQIMVLGALAFLLMLSEGVASSWSALEAVHVLHQRPAMASLAFGVFATCMTIGRLLGDRVVAAVGPVQVVRYGTLVAAAGMAIVVVSRFYPLTLLGWAIYGIGLAGGIPQIFTAAGNLHSAKPGAPLAQAVGVGYVGELGGPAIIGLMSGLIGLTGAFCIPLFFCLAASGAANSVKPAAPV